MNIFPNGSIPSQAWSGAPPVAAPKPMTVMVEGQNAGLPQINADGSIEIELPDGSLQIDLAPKPEGQDSDSFNENLAEILTDAELGVISSEIMDGIEADKQSRSEWLSQVTKGIDLLGLKTENPRIDVGSSAPLEGMSTVRHPMMQQALLLFQANFRGASDTRSRASRFGTVMG